MRRRIAVIVVAVTIASSGPLCAQAPDHVERAPGGSSATPAPKSAPNPATKPAAKTEPVEKAARDSIRTLRLQTDLAEKAAKDSIRSLGLQTEMPKQVEPIRIPIPEWVIWTALICAAALIAYALRDSVFALLRGAQEGWETPAPGSQDVAFAGETDTLAAADKLSREGRFVEAMHLLLLHSLAEIRRQLGEKFADSLTSREIVRVAKLNPPGRTSLREIVAAVERTYFGAYPAEAGDYATCRENFATLQHALRGGAPA